MREPGFGRFELLMQAVSDFFDVFIGFWQATPSPHTVYEYSGLAERLVKPTDLVVVHVV
jgi:hypothetical protein